MDTGSNIWIILILLIAILIVAYVIDKRFNVTPSVESFETVQQKPKSNTNCPTSAIKTPDGKIQVQPGNKTFSTMNEYLAFLNELYAKGETCIPPKVTSHKEPVPGILGGLGNGKEGPNAANLQGATREVLNFSPLEEQTYTNTNINKVDDYDHTRVFDTESGSRNALTEKSKSELINQRTLDWANLPFNSEKREKKEDAFVAARMEAGFRDPATGVFFENVDGKSVHPPDKDASKEREDKVLSAYKPTDISTHTINPEMRSVADIVNKMYAEDKNWEPVVKKVSDYQWEITEVRPKARKEKWEDETETKNLAMAEERGEALPPPSISIDDRNRNDPYFDKSGVGDKDHNRYWKYEDFNKWTPGLERMFAPTLDNKEWY